MSRRSLIPVLPTAMTLGNLVCGFMAMAKTVDAMSQSGGEVGNGLEQERHFLIWSFHPSFPKRCWLPLAACS